MNCPNYAIRDGLYQVTTEYLCAGFVVKNHCIIACAPILCRRFNYWLHHPKCQWIGD